VRWENKKMKWFKTIYYAMGILMLISGFSNKKYLQIVFGILFMFLGFKAIK
jgi:hypothetical protein